MTMPAPIALVYAFRRAGKMVESLEHADHPGRRWTELLSNPFMRAYKDDRAYSLAQKIGGQAESTATLEAAARDIVFFFFKRS